ncbi:hypothetical protein FSARC_5570 [Fusarium sarcochroum]|uniref:Negative regulator of differentiation 1 n=1 Tax=Fusarium sarcochroum TaxID=1208366 RepID=A0A8H4X9C4_9HYPO|nr:hypothetical protein FSARC_5570 [Fusarium sarcochroum]
MDMEQTPAGSEPPVYEPQYMNISQQEYDGLVAMAHRYVCLRQNLSEQGIDDASLDLLSQPMPVQQTTFNTPEDAGQPTSTSYVPNTQAPPYQNRPSAAFGRDNQGQGPHVDRNRHLNTSSHSFGYPDDSLDHHPRIVSAVDKRPDSSRWLERSAQRSIQLLNLVPGVTHGDITAVVRGGPLLEVFLRTRDCSAIVSFVHEADAVAFLDHSRKQGLYIKDRQVPTKWADHQFFLKGNVAYHITKGASRNFVIRKRDPNLTAQGIRNDLEHIHGLRVIDIKIERDNCFVSTNSINAAIFAQSCLMSRLEFKGSRIDWAADECAQPLESLPSQTRTSTPHSKPNDSSTNNSSDSALPRRKNLMGNRFRLLNLSDTDDSRDDDSSCSGSS